MQYMNKIKLVITALALITLTVTFNGINPNIVFAKTVEEIQAEIEQKQAELAKINEEMNAVNKTLQENKAVQGGYNSEISKVRSKIASLESELSLLDLQSRQITEEINLAQLQKDEAEKRQDNQIIDSYIIWKTAKGTLKVDSDILKQAIYFEAYQNATEGQILGLADQITKLTTDREGFEKQKVTINKQISDFSAQKALLDAQVKQYNDAVRNANASMNTMRSAAKGVTQSIDQLSQEQQNMMNADNNLTAGGTGGTDIITTGQFYFAGTGRDRFQGHGVGLSQWGAYGAAKNHGWSAEQILKLYYIGVVIETRPGATISVVGNGTMDIETYVAGLGEIPDKACGSSEQIIAWAQFADSQNWSADDPKRAKYVIDNPGTEWDCWPEETIKAQVIAARSYGITSGQPICTTASCQVYKGGLGKAWAAFDTAGKYIVYNGQIIRAYYSSDNSQGFGTANNDTIFSGYDGIGWPTAYLRHADDTAVAGNYQYTRWAWRTNGYTIADINTMFNSAVGNYEVGKSANNYIKGIKQKVGTITGLSLTKDSSNRVRYVTLIGSNGSGNIQGELFKYIWNDWVARTHTQENQDYIYSKTFSFLQK